MSETTAVPAIHPTAVIDPQAIIEPGARVGPYCVIGADARIESGAVLHNHVTLHGPAVVGAESVVYPYAVLGAEPQDLKYAGGRTELIVGKRCRIREHATIHRGTELGGGKTVIGDDCLIMVGAHIAHDCVIENEVVIANGVMLGGHCLVEFGATIAGGAGVHHFATVGELSFIGGMARIVKDVPPYLVVEGTPAEPRKVNTTALIRRGWSVEAIESLRTAYKALYRSDEPMQFAMERLRSDPVQTRAALRLCDALEAIHLGVHGRCRESQRDQAAPRN